MLLGLWLSLNMVFAETTSDIEVLVKGMVCSFCVQGVEKKFSGEDSVEKVEVKLDESKVLLWIKDDQSLSDDTINDLIKDAGYNVESITRTPTPTTPTSDSPTPAKEK